MIENWVEKCIGIRIENWVEKWVELKALGNELKIGIGLKVLKIELSWKDLKNGLEKALGWKRLWDRKGFGLKNELEKALDWKMGWIERIEKDLWKVLKMNLEN